MLRQMNCLVYLLLGSMVLRVGAGIRDRSQTELLCIPSGQRAPREVLLGGAGVPQHRAPTSTHSPMRGMVSADSVLQTMTPRVWESPRDAAQPWYLSLCGGAHVHHSALCRPRGLEQTSVHTSAQLTRNEPHALWQRGSRVISESGISPLWEKTKFYKWLRY